MAGNYQGTLSATLTNQAQATTAWFLYPGACADRALGTWAPRTSPQADSLDTYPPGSTGPYTVLDQSISEILWHVSDNGTCIPDTNCPPAIAGTRMLWCGKFDANWFVKYGYPNLTYQILYFDTGAHAGNYTLSLKHNFSSELYYDFIYLIGGGDNAVDPIGNSHSTLDNIIASGAVGNQRLLVRWDGIIVAGTVANTTGGTVLSSGNASGAPATVTSTFTIEAQHRALYLVFQSDCFVSTEDGFWPAGRGQQIDDVSTSDNGAIYTDEAPLVNSQGFTCHDGFSGNVLKGTITNDLGRVATPVVSARVVPGLGTLWQLVRGSNLPTPDACTPKNTTTDLIFEGANASNFHTVPNQFNSIVSCSFPIPAGTASVVALWDEYVDLPLYQGYVAYSEFRIFKDGSWGNWAGMGGGVIAVAAQRWFLQRGDELAEASQADSVQLRYNIQCVPGAAADGHNCGDVIYGVLYDNLRLEIVTGVPAPVFAGVAVAQSMFVDGTMAGVNCNASTVAAGQCWPGIRGSDNGISDGLYFAIHDNFNSPFGDRIGLFLGTGLRKNGKGINWHHGFDLTVSNGLTIAHTNPDFVAAYDSPRIIYRIFDPATRTWSPFDSSELDANAVSVQAGDTLLTGGYGANWPFRDKAGTPYPGGFTLNRNASYPLVHPSGSGGGFLPRGARVQYYFKAVDINGGTTYQFSSDALAREVEDLPTLPGSSNIAPDIIEFDVLPRVYDLGAGGTQLAGRRDTPILDLDGSYLRWSYETDATVEILRSLGVRADRYRLLAALRGAGLGGHELAGTHVFSLVNYFPNMEEYGIKDSLAKWYRIMIQSSHHSIIARDSESDAKLIKAWWEDPTGNDGGDRCIFASGDDYFNSLLAVSGVPNPNEYALATQVFGVGAAANHWNGGALNQFPNIKDLFSDPAAGPAFGSGSYTYIIDGGCPGPNRFDALTKIASSEARNAGLYPTIASVTNVAGVSYMTERDVLIDHDRNKSLGYGFSIQLIRQGGMNMVDTRAQVLYKFLTSCRGPRTTADTASCWPCPTDANKYGNWATSFAFQTGTYGPLYPIQDATRSLTGVGNPRPESPRFANALSQNRPNPFNPETIIPYSVAARGNVTIRIYDIAGRCIRTLVDAVKDPGIHHVRWTGELDSGGEAASSIYFYRITYPDGTSSAKKMAILR